MLIVQIYQIKLVINTYILEKSKFNEKWVAHSKHNIDVVTLFWTIGLVLPTWNLILNQINSGARHFRFSIIWTRLIIRGMLNIWPKSKQSSGLMYAGGNNPHDFCRQWVFIGRMPPLQDFNCTFMSLDKNDFIFKLTLTSLLVMNS